MESSATPGLVIRTSSSDWLSRLAAAYRAMTPVTLIDDANIGIDPLTQTLFEMGQRANLARREWYAVLTALGVAGAGIFLLYMAIVDPEPFSKIGFAIGAGTVMTMGGGFAAIRILTGHKPPTVKVSPRGGFEISWE